MVQSVTVSHCFGIQVNILTWRMRITPKVNGEHVDNFKTSHINDKHDVIKVKNHRVLGAQLFCK